MNTDISTSKILCNVLIYFGNKKHLILMVIASLLRNVRDLSCVITLAYATDQVLSGGNVVLGITLMLIAMFSGAPVLAFQSYVSRNYFLKGQKKLQLDISNRISKLPIDYFKRNKTGDVISAYSVDMELICEWTTYDFPAMIQFATYILGALIYSMYENVLLTLFVFPVIIFIIPLLTKIAKPMQKTSDIQLKETANAVSEMQDILRDPEFLKAYGLESTMDERFANILETKRKAQQKSGFYSGLVQGLTTFGSYLPGFVAALVGVVFLSNELITAGFLVGFIQMVVQKFGKALPDVGNFATANNKAGASAKRIMALLNEPSEREDGISEIPKSSKVFEFENTSFSYDEEKNTVLHGVDLYVKEKETIALVGNSGSGKSTVIKLMLGLYEVDSGHVNVYERNIKNWNLKALRELMAPVFQEVLLFPTSIRENITYEKVSDAEVWRVLEQAGLKDFVEKLPNKLDTVIGEHGVTLSGGQQQRLTIARALIKNAPIILLDEPTSALDSITEHEFQTAFDILKKEKTTVVVAHRLQTIRNADRIYVFDKGKVVAQGTHESLIMKDGVYKTLYQSQLKMRGEAI